MFKKPVTSKSRLLLCIFIYAIILLFVLLLITNILEKNMGFKEHVNYSKIYNATDFGLISKDDYITTSDGYQIWISDIQVDKPKAVVIQLSGIQQPSVTIFYSQAKFLKENNYASVLVDLRGHGNSSGNRIAFGYEETRDIQAVVDYIHAQDIYKDVPIVIYGVSMGGAVAINAFGAIEDIDSLISLSAYADWANVCSQTLRETGIPTIICTSLKWGIKLSNLLTFHNDAIVNVPKKRILNIGDRNVFLIHSSGDYTVPVSNFYILYDVIKDKSSVKIWVRDAKEHFIVKDNKLLSITDDVEYCQNILTFLEKQYARSDING